MIVCSCRVLTDKDFTSTLDSETPDCPRTAMEAYRCLGCGPECGRCLKMVRRILADARAASRCHDCVQDCALRDAAHDEALMHEVLAQEAPVHSVMPLLDAAE